MEPSAIAIALAVLPDGSPAMSPLDRAEIGKYLSDHYNNAAEVERRDRHARRNVLYADGGCEYMCGVIDSVFQDPEVRELRKSWVKHARFSNSLKRIVNEGSTVYSEPAQRSVGGGAENEAKYAAALSDSCIDEVMDYANRMLNLHRAILIGPRVRVEDDGRRSVTLDVVTPDNVFAVVDPNDATRVIAWGIRVAYRSARAAWPEGVPAWNLWNASESWLLNKDMMPIGAPKPHGLGVNPWIGVTYHAESIPGYWPGEEGEDLVAAQVAIWMSNVLLLKETKSATNVPVLSGDVSTMERGQAADSERMLHAPEGVSVSSIDMSMDTATFTRAGDHALERVGNNHGMSMGTLTHQGTQSAEARELMLEPLRQLRRKQIKTLRRVEGRVAKLTSQIVAVDAPDLAFDVVRFACNFGEPQALTDESTRLAVFEKKKALGLTSVVEYYIAFIDPDATPDEAFAAIANNITIEENRIIMMRKLMAMSGELGGNAARADTAMQAAHAAADKFGPATAAPGNGEVVNRDSAPNSAGDTYAA